MVHDDQDDRVMSKVEVARVACVLAGETAAAECT